MQIESQRTFEFTAQRHEEFLPKYASMLVITFSVSVFFGFSPGIIVMAFCFPFAFSRLPF